MECCVPTRLRTARFFGNTRRGGNSRPVNGVPGFGGAIGATAPTIVDGMMYMGSGYAVILGAPGNVLLAFGLD